MKKVAVFYVFLILGANAATAQSVITIEVQGNGNALWVIEKRLPLADQKAVDDWEGFIRDTEKYRSDISDFRRRITGFMESAETYSNRSMKAVDFNISYGTAKTLSGDFGVIRYSFEWKRFSRGDSGNMFIGDVFSEGMLLPPDSVLIMEIPEGYDAISASPEFDRRDGNRLIWDGSMYRSFGKGEPALVLSKASSNSLWLALGVLAALTAGASLLLRKRSTLMPERTVPEEELQYEEMIEKFLLKSGGEAYQSEIVNESRLSKSKISVVLAKMKEDGQILKIRRGKENLIRLRK